MRSPWSQSSFVNRWKWFHYFNPEISCHQPPEAPLALKWTCQSSKWDRSPLQSRWSISPKTWPSTTWRTSGSWRSTRTQESCRQAWKWPRRGVWWSVLLQEKRFWRWLLGSRWVTFIEHFPTFFDDADAKISAELVRVLAIMCFKLAWSLITLITLTTFTGEAGRGQVVALPSHYLLTFWLSWQLFWYWDEMPFLGWGGCDMGGRYFQRRHRYTMNKCNEIGQLFEEVMRIMVCWS